MGSGIAGRPLCRLPDCQALIGVGLAARPAQVDQGRTRILKARVNNEAKILLD